MFNKTINKYTKKEKKENIKYSFISNVNVKGNLVRKMVHNLI